MATRMQNTLPSQRQTYPRLTWLGGLLALITLMFAVSSQAAIDAYQFDTAEQEQLFRELAQELRCPKCQNQNIADSDAGLAKDLRDKTYEMVKQGKDRQQIIDFMVLRYGDFIHYTPPTSAALVIVVIPVLFILAGFVVVWMRSRSRQQAVATEVSAQQLQQAEALLREPQQQAREEDK